MHVVDLTMFWSEQGGGVQRYLRAKNTHLLRGKDNARHTIVVPGRLVATPPEIPGIPIPFGAGYRLPRNLGAVQRVLRSLRPDVIEAGDPYQLAWAALRAGEEAGATVTAFYHSDMPELIARTFGEYARRAAARYVKRLYRRFDAVFAPSAYVASRLADLGIENVIVQPLGVDTRLFEPGRRDPGWRTLHQLSPRARVLLYVGRYASEKNLEVMSAAVRRLGPPYVLVTIGGGPTPPSGPRVIALPYESNPLQLARAYASADVFVHAGDQETFGLAALEALASGLPVVGCAQGGVAEIIDGPFGMAVARCQADHFAEAIDTIDRRSQDTDIASAARARAIEYEWETVLARLDHHYARLVGAARSGYAPLEQRAA